MSLLILGLVVFLGIHIVPAVPGLRASIVDRLSKRGYLIVFSVVSLVGLVLLVLGLGRAPFVPLYEPPAWGRPLAMLLMLPALYLFLSNPLGAAPSSAKALTANPMSWGIVVWSVAHLFANGDQAHVVFFVAMLIYSVVSMTSANRRGAQPKLAVRPPFKKEVVFVAIVLLVYAGIIWLHPFFTGMPVIHK